MPRASTGSLRNATALLRLFGRAVTLPDGSVIKMVYKTRFEDDLSDMERPRRRYVHRLWTPVILQGTFDAKQTVLVDLGRKNAPDLRPFYVQDYQVDEDDWLEAIVSPTSPVPDHTFGSDFGDDFRT